MATISQDAQSKDMPLTTPPAAPLTADGFLGGAVTIRQPAKGFRAGIDSVMLAAAVLAKAQDRVLELGIGAGVASLCLAHRVRGVAIVGVDYQPDMVDLARDNAALNGFAGTITLIEADIAAPAAALIDKGLSPNSFDHVFANPPYYDPDRAALPPDKAKARAHATLGATLADWTRACGVMARPKGTVTMVHRADALPGLLAGLGRYLGGLEIIPLWPARNKPASRILVRGIKGSRAPLRLHPGLRLHEPEGGFTPEAEAILRHGAALTVG